MKVEEEIEFIKSCRQKVLFGGSNDKAGYILVVTCKCYLRSDSNGYYMKQDGVISLHSHSHNGYTGCNAEYEFYIPNHQLEECDILSENVYQLRARERIYVKKIAY